MKVIESKDNATYKKLVALKSTAYARKSGLIAVEGLRHAMDVLESGYTPEFIFFADDDKGREARRIILEKGGGERIDGEDGRFISLSAPLFRRASSQKTPQGVIAVVAYRPAQLDGYLDSIKDSGSVHRLLILEAIQDPGNIGTLIRTADAFSFDGVVLTDTSASVWNPKTVAASMGSLFHLSVYTRPGNMGDLITSLKAAGFEVIGTGLDGENVLEAGRFGPKLALILGSEGSGLSSEAVERSDRVLRIPMAGRAESLNVASAGAILLWELAGNARGRAHEMV